MKKYMCSTAAVYRNTIEAETEEQAKEIFLSEFYDKFSSDEIELMDDDEIDVCDM